MQGKKTDKIKNIAIISTVLLLTVLAAIVFLQKTVQPANPLEDKRDVSAMWLSDSNLLVSEPQMDKLESAGINTAESKKNQEPEEREESQDKDKENAAENNGADNKDEQNKDGDSKAGGSGGQPGTPDISQIIGIDGNSQSAEEQQNGGSGQGPGEGPGSGQGNESGDGENIGPVEPTEPGDDESVDAYFTTSIISGDIVDDKDYSFTIKHLKPELTVLGISVSTNGDTENYAPKTKHFETKLTTEKNNIVVKVLYRSGEDTITASKSYVLYYAPGDKVVIITDLYDSTIDTDTVDFSAYGIKAGQRIEAHVKVNGQRVRGSDDRFTAPLDLGRNTITITAGGRKDSVTETYTVTYAENIFKIVTTISDTVLYGTENQTQPESVVYTGADQTYKFKITVNKVTGKEELVSVRAFNYDGTNGKVLKKGAGGYYTTELPVRKPSLITLTYLDSDGEKHRYSYSVRYKRAGDTTPESRKPAVNVMVEVGSSIMNLQTGMKFKSPDIILNINAKSWQGEQLYGSDFIVKANGYTYPQQEYQTGYWYGYGVYLREGENTISVTATDLDQYSTTKTYKIYYNPGKVKVTVSVEATTVGLGYLIPRQTVEVDGGTNVAQIVTSLLQKYGYDYRAAGSVDNGFYLQAIEKPGITDGYRIPPDLAEAIQKDGGDISSETGFHPDSLGEFDFYRYSGWMYSYNGSYPGYSMASCKPQDGAVIRIRFTLALGKDIGGYKNDMGSYGSVSGNYGKEW